MNDDLNTSGALAVLFELARPLRALANRIERDDLEALHKKETRDAYFRWELLIKLAGVLGLQRERPKSYLSNKCIIDEAKIKTAIQDRNTAKSNKDFAQADKIRDELKAMGIQLIDKPNGVTEWIYL